MMSNDKDARYDFNHGHPWLRPLAREVSRAMRKSVSKYMRRSEKEWRIFASLTMDFILDVTNAHSLWMGYESWNLRHFGVALPITEGNPGTGLTNARLRHFIWKALALLAADFSLEPEHPDMNTLVDAVEAFWEKRKAKFSPVDDSSAFCAGPNDSGWNIKGKLITLGESSYFFRLSCAEHVMPYRGSDYEFDAIDDFLCQNCSVWSGMGPIDLLAEALELPEARREDIRAWSQRHSAPYRVDEISDEVLVTNLASDTQYRVEKDQAVPPFETGMVMIGSLAPWKGMWRWSGAQRILGSGKKGVTDAKEKVVGEMRRSMGGTLCRYWPEYREQVLKIAGETYRDEIEFYGGRDLVYFETYEPMVESQKEFFTQRRRKIKQSMKTAQEKDAPMNFDVPLPDAVDELGDGVAVFLHSKEGAEMMFGYDALIQALRKKGTGLDEDEREVLREFMNSNAISPAFVRRVLEDEPDESIKTEFGMPENIPAYWLDWLLRCWKGEYYRTRYPTLSIA